METSNSDDFDEVTSKLADTKLGVIAKRIKKKGNIIPNIPIGRALKSPRISRKHRWLMQSPFLFNDVVSLASINEGDDYTVGTTLCRNCGVSFCPKNGTMCHDCLMKQETSVVGMPKSILVKHCEGCQSYSFTGRTEFFSAPARSASLLRFLLRRININLYRLHLSLVSALYLPTNPGDKNIRMVLMLEEEFPHGGKVEKHHVIDYVVEGRLCPTCSNMVAALELNSVVKFRQFGDSQPSLFSLLIGLPRRALGHPVKKCVPVSNGVDFFFTNDIDMMEFYDLLCFMAPIRPANLIKTADGSCIEAVMCPISYGDLVYIRSEEMASWSFSGPVAICTGISNSITFSDPFSLMQRTLSAVEYWNAHFEPLKTSRDLTEFLVVDVQIVSTENVHSLADVEVARLSDFGKSDLTLMGRSHLGHILRPGDHALGYDLCGIQSSLSGSGESTVLLPEVALVRKKHISPRARRKKTSPEYEEFLRDLDKNPEAMFKLSLNNGNNAEKQQSEIGSTAPVENSDFDIEGLLADLHLGGVENAYAITEQ